MASQMNVICKVELEGDMRRLQLTTPLSLPRLLEDIRAKFALPAEAQYRLVWTDADGDLITVATTEALVDAAGSTGGALRLQLVASSSRLFAPSASPEVTRKLRVLRRRQAILQRRLELAASHNAHIQQRLEALRQAEAQLLQEHPELAALAPETPAPEPQREEGEAARRAERARRFGCPAFGGAFAMARMLEFVCDGCEAPIPPTDIRFKCADCPNYDLCVTCEAKNIHNPAHGLLKLRPEAQASHPNLPIHRPLLGGGRGGCGPFGGRAAAAAAGLFCGRAAAAAAATPLNPMEQINKLFAEAVLPQLSGLLPPNIDVAAIFNQLLQTVQRVQPALFQELANLAAELLAQGQLSLDAMLPRLVAFVESKASLINEELIMALLMPLLGSCCRVAPSAAAEFNPFEMLGGLASLFSQAVPSARPVPTPVPAPTPTPETQQPDFSPLAALSIPPEIMEQLVNIASNPSEALALWEAMNQ